jgi:PAS domain S-box-containing protein
LQEADKELRRLKLMTLGSKEGFWYWPDTTQNEIEWSDQFFVLLGYQPQEFELYFIDFQSMIHKHDVDNFLHVISHAIAAKSIFELEFRIQCKDGTYRWFLGRGSPYFNDSGNVHELAGSISDIHKQKVLEQKLKKSNERYNQAIEAVGVGIWEWDLKTEEMYWSPAHYRLLGFEENEIKVSFEELKNRIHKDDLQQVLSSLDAHFKNNKKYAIEYRILCKNKRYRWFKVSGMASKNAKGKVLSMAGSLEDIHEKKTAQLQIELANMRFELATQGATVGVFDWYDIENDKAFLSDRYLELVGLTRGEIGGSFGEFSTLMHPDDRVPTYEHVQGVLAGKHPYNFEYRVMHKEKGYRWFHGTAAVRRDTNGNAVQMIGSMQDIHERKQAEVEREQLIQKLRTSNDELDQFAYIASHDLKAPLRVIDNASSWLEEDIGHKLANDDLENLQLIRSRALRMEKLLDDLLEYSRVGRKTDARYTSTVSGDELLNDALLLIDKPESFDINIDKAFANINVNLMPLLQIFVNLLSNATKHHDKTSGTISITLDEEFEHFIFSVCDDGPGIAQEYHQKIFGMFQTLQSRDRVEGSGMGLALVKKHIDLQGGHINIESTLGKGCTFKITWPKIK